MTKYLLGTSTKCLSVTSSTFVDYIVNICRLHDKIFVGCMVKSFVGYIDNIFVGYMTKIFVGYIDKGFVGYIDTMSLHTRNVCRYIDKMFVGYVGYMRVDDVFVWLCACRLHRLHVCRLLAVTCLSVAWVTCWSVTPI